MPEAWIYGEIQKISSLARLYRHCYLVYAGKEVSVIALATIAADDLAEKVSRLGTAQKSEGGTPKNHSLAA